MQRVRARAVTGVGGPLVDLARVRAAAAVARTPIGGRIARTVAHGSDPLGVRTDFFSVLAAALT